MDTNLIILELLSRIKILEEKVKVLEEKNLECHKIGITKPDFPSDKISGKYRPIAEYLYEKWEKKIILTYAEIEKILDFKLPQTAYKFPMSYWANTLTHTYATSWLSVGYNTRVNIETLSVTFERIIY